MNIGHIFFLQLPSSSLDKLPPPIILRTNPTYEHIADAIVLSEVNRISILNQVKMVSRRHLFEHYSAANQPLTIE